MSASEPTRAEWKDWAAGIEKPEPRTFGHIGHQFLNALQGWVIPDYAGMANAQNPWQLSGMYGNSQVCPHCGCSNHSSIGGLFGNLMSL